MYGTVARMRVKPGQAQKLMEISDRQNKQLGQGVKGYIGEFVYRLDKDSNELILVVLFEDKQSYAANAESPDQDVRYREVRACLESDPQWDDGEIIYQFGDLAKR